MRTFIIIAAFLFLAPCAQAQKLSSATLDQLMERMEGSDTVYVLNFWATWCAPCIRELPEFEALDKIYRSKPVKVLLVSLDFADAYPGQISLFQKRRRLVPEVVWLNETKPNEFIPRIHQGWEGSIPATWVYRHGTALSWFREGMIEAPEIESVLEKALKP